MNVCITWMHRSENRDKVELTNELEGIGLNRDKWITPISSHDCVQRQQLDDLHSLTKRKTKKKNNQSKPPATIFQNQRGKNKSTPKTLKTQ